MEVEKQEEQDEEEGYRTWLEVNGFDPLDLMAPSREYWVDTAAVAPRLAVEGATVWRQAVVQVGLRIFTHLSISTSF